jgi:hypothetical protein
MIFQIYDGSGSRLERQYLTAHEITHQVANDKIGGAASVMLSEGLAMYTGERYLLLDGAVTLDGFSRAALLQGKLIPITTLSSGSARFYGRLFHRYPYDEAGSFVGYLIRTYGTAKFKRVYTSNNYSGVYGKSLTTLGSDWERYLRSDKARRPLAPDNALYLTGIRDVQDGYHALNIALSNGKRVRVTCYMALDAARLAADRADFATAERQLVIFYDTLPAQTVMGAAAGAYSATFPE